MKLEALIDVNFRSGLFKLVNGNIPMKTVFALDEVLTTVEEELKKYEKVRQLALKKYAKLKDDGSLETTDKGDAVFKSEDDSKAFFKEHADLVATEVSVAKVKMSELGPLDKIGVTLTVEELRKLKSNILEL